MSGRRKRRGLTGASRLCHARPMATRASTIEFLQDQLAELEGVRVLKMFGEYALYYQDKVVGLVCDDQLFVKLTTEGKAVAGEQHVEASAYPGARPSLRIGADVLEDDEQLCELIRITAKALPPPKPKKKRAGKKKVAKKKAVKKKVAAKKERRS